MASTSIHINELDKESKIYGMHGFSFAIILFCGIFLLGKFSPFFSLDIPENKNNEKTNVFIFAIDSLRFDRISDDKYKDVMPFLRTQLKNAVLVEPMLVGIARTFPSWVEIATGNYASNTGVRSMFPPRQVRLEKAQTMYSLAQDQGYKTIAISDFAGDIFPRYPFGIETVLAPSSNMETLIENALIGSFSALQSILTLPHLHRALPSLLESPEIADPRLLTHSFSQVFSQQEQGKESPLFFTTFFSTAHFPYAAPSPFFAKFQQKNSQGKYIFRKDPDQKIDENTSSGEEIFEEKVTPEGGRPFEEPISEETKKQIISLYDGALHAIDREIMRLITELQKKGWLKNSLILIFGDHGENLYDGALGMGHGDGVQGEFSSITPLVILASGKAKENLQRDSHSTTLVRSVDIAPTILKRLNIGVPRNIDGVPLLDTPDFLPHFPKNMGYTESGLWFIKGAITPERRQRIIYPSITGVLDIDPGMNHEFYLNPVFAQTIFSVKERAWVNKKYRLVARTTTQGIGLSLYDRTQDKYAQNDLLDGKNKENLNKYKNIARDLFHEMNAYLQSRGVEIIKNSENNFFYSENVHQ